MRFSRSGLSFSEKIRLLPVCGVVGGCSEPYFLLRIKKDAKKNRLLCRISLSKKSGSCCLFAFDFYVGVIGALPPFPTSFLDPKKEAKKESAALPLFKFSF